MRAYIANAVMARMANSSLIVLLGYHLYQLTGDPLTLGWLGLAQAIPAITLMLYGGVIADRHSRRSIVLLERGAYTGWQPAWRSARWRLRTQWCGFSTPLGFCWAAPRRSPLRQSPASKARSCPYKVHCGRSQSWAPRPRRQDWPGRCWAACCSMWPVRACSYPAVAALFMAS